MAVIMYVDFPHKDVWGKEMANQMKELAQSITNEPGFIWKFWTENKKDEMAGGVYMFGYSDIKGKVFEVNETLSTICKAPF